MTITLLLLFVSLAQAQTGHVVKVKGSKAIVDFGSEAVSEGQQVTVGANTGHASASGQQGRQHGISYSFTYSSMKYTAVEDKTMTSQANYLYNITRFEIGGMFSYSGTDGAIKQVTTSFGPLARYDIYENKKGVNLVPYVGGGLTLDSQDTAGSKASGNTIFAMGGADWFPFSQIFAVDAGLKFGQSSIDAGGAKNTTSNLGLYAGWSVYF